MKNIIMNLFGVFFQRARKNLIARPFAGHIRAQDMHVWGCCLTFGGENMRLIADCPDCLGQFTDGTLRPAQGDIRPLNYYCDLCFHSSVKYSIRFVDILLPPYNILLRHIVLYISKDSSVIEKIVCVLFNGPIVLYFFAVA